MSEASRTARLSAAAIALTAGAGIAVQFGVSVHMSGSAVWALWVMLRYFTVIANLGVAFVFLGFAFDVPRCASPFVMGGITLVVLLVGVVQALLLHGMFALSGAAKLADLLLHDVTPVLVPLHWLIFSRKGGLLTRDPWLWCLLPLAYFCYASLRGASEGVYPYPFIDIVRLGWPRTLANALALASGFIAAGFVLVWLDRRLPTNGRQ